MLPQMKCNAIDVRGGRFRQENMGVCHAMIGVPSS